MLTTTNNIISPSDLSSSQTPTKTGRNKTTTTTTTTTTTSETLLPNNNENDMLVDKDNDITMKESESNHFNDPRINKKNREVNHFNNRNNSNKGYKSNYRNNNKLNHKNSNPSMLSDFSSHGRNYNGSSRGGNKKSRPNYNNSSNTGNGIKRPVVKDIKEIQNKLDKKLAAKESSTLSSPSITDNINSNTASTENENNTIQTQLTLDHYDPNILKDNTNPPSSVSPSTPPESTLPEPSTTTETTTTKETESTEDVVMETEEPDFLNGFSSDKIENAGKIFIGGLTYDTTDEKLRKHFEQYGKITECTVMKDNNGCSRGFGFITYENPEVLDKVLEINHILDGKTIDPKRAIPRDRQDKTEKIFVGGIHPDVTEAEFKAAFDSFGKVIDATLITAKDTGKSRCFGFITYEDGRGVEVAYANRHNIVLNGKKVEVKYAAPKQKLAAGAMNPMMLNMNGMNNMNGMRLPMGIPIGMGVINLPPQPHQQPHMPPPKMTKGNSTSPKNKQSQKYYQPNIRSGQVGPIRNQHNHAYPQDFQYSRYNLNMNMNMYTTYNYNPYNNAAGYMGYEYDNYNIPPMAGYGNPPPYPNGTTSYPSGYLSRNMNSYPQSHPYTSGTSNNNSSSGHSSYSNGHGGNGSNNGSSSGSSSRNGGGNSSNYYRNPNHSTHSTNPMNLSSNPSSLSGGSGSGSGYNVYSGYGMNVYSNNYVPFNSHPSIARMNSNSSSSSSNGGSRGHGSNANPNPASISGNGDPNGPENDDMSNSALYMGVNPRNNHGYHPYSR